MKRVEAYAAELKGDKFELKDVRIYEAGQPVEKINNIDYKTTLTIDRIKENFIDPEAISFWNLPDTIHFYEMSGFSALRHQMRYMSLWNSPSCCARCCWWRRCLRCVPITGGAG